MTTFHEAVEKLEAIVASRRRKPTSSPLTSGGASMNPEIARKVLDIFSGAKPKQSDQGLTERELEVLRLVVTGLTKKEIAVRTDLSQHTVDSHLRNIYLKLHVNNRASAVATALRERLV